MTDFTMTTDADGVAVITWDCPEKSMNVLNWDALRTLDGFIDTVVADATIKGGWIFLRLWMDGLLLYQIA